MLQEKTISPHIFRAYDIRGIYNHDISPELFQKIGMAAGTFVQQNLNGKTMTVGNDLRKSSVPLALAFISGVTATGVEVLYTGTTAFGQTLFSGWQHQQDLIAFITASHLPAEWNGVKFYYGDGVGLSEDQLMTIRDITLTSRTTNAAWDRLGTVTLLDPKKEYRTFFQQRFTFKKKLTVALDCGGASTTLSAPEIFRAVGLNIIPVFCDPDPTFSKRPSDPKPENLTTLVETVKQHRCDFGVAFDGDGDRAVIVDNTGKILSADETGIIIGTYGLPKKQGTIIVNVECSKAVAEYLQPQGYTIKQIQVGHTFLTLAAKKEHALLGIESSGHLIMPDYFLFDDALIIPLKIAEILQTTQKKLHDLIKPIPLYPRQKKEIECPDHIKFNVIETLKQQFTKEYHNTNTLDGIRVDLQQGWILLRASNTSPIIRLTVEANTEHDVAKLTEQFLEKTTTMIATLKNK
ncbi:MAG: phosphomannomutase/phosphoglucomutase [Candidatus Thermoplasmatota archaeon]